MNKKEILDEKLKIIVDINNYKNKLESMIESQKKHSGVLDKKIIQHKNSKTDK